MNILVLLAHPKKGSFNHAIAEATLSVLKQNNHDVIYHDLYAESFDPILTGDEIPKDAELPELIKKHCEDVVNADGIIIIHPNWWGQPPAILKGWVDRVIRAGVAYEFQGEDMGEGVPVGLLKAKSAVVFNTSDTAEDREDTVFGDPLETLWKNCIFGLCGVENFHRRMFGIIITSSLEQRQEWLSEVEIIIQNYFS